MLDCNNVQATHCCVFIKCGASSFVTVKPLKESTSKSSFSFSSHIICLLLEGSLTKQSEFRNLTGVQQMRTTHNTATHKVQKQSLRVASIVPALSSNTWGSCMKGEQ